MVKTPASRVVVPQIDRVTLLYQPDDQSKLRNYAFVNYVERSSAVRAVAEAENKKHTLEGKELVVGAGVLVHGLHVDPASLVTAC